MTHEPTKMQVAETRREQADSGQPAPAEGHQCIHCLADVTLVDLPRSDPQRQAWSDGHPRYPFYCPKALNLTHRVLDVTA